MKASTSKLFQANTRSAGVRPGSPQSGSTAGPLAAAVDLDALERARTETGISGGRHSGTLIAPRASVMQASACASTMPAFEISPPQLPE